MSTITRPRPIHRAWKNRLLTALLGLLSALPLLPALVTAAPEVPYFAEAVAAGTLPPVEQRLPETPSVADFTGKTAGEYGGRLRMLMAREKDTRMMTVYGYARLVALDQNLNLKPDILESVDNEDNRVFTLHIRKGHRWSDGEPFTAEDFRFYWEDVAQNKDLSKYGPPQALKNNDELPRVQMLDEHTVSYTWSSPNPYFLPAIADASPLYIYLPAHHLKKFHNAYTDEAKLEKMAEEKGKKNWKKQFLDEAKLYDSNNPDVPTLQPWINTSYTPTERFLFKRNPYFHRVDPQGRQLPYLDEVEINIASNSLIAAKAGSGESDLQARYVRMDNFTFLKAAEKEVKNLKVLLWDTALGSQIALFPNLNSEDPEWRTVMRDVRFRRALSMAVDRHEINEVIYFGLALEGADTVLPSCPMYDVSLRNAWSAYDIQQANALLDEMGLTERDNRGIRLFPDGRPLEIIVQSAGESTEETDVLALVKDTWRDIGIDLYVKPTEREVLRNRVFSGQAHMSVWSGLPNGIPTADMSPEQLAPTRQDQYQWPMWGRHAETGEGEAPDIAEVTQLAKLNKEWSRTLDPKKRHTIWQEMLGIYSDQVFSIGLISQVLQPVVINPRLQNIPEKGVFNWSPGAFFGIYRPDTFWYSKAGS